MSTEGEAPDQPAWAVRVERAEDGRTLFRDEQGDPVVALAVTREELTRLESGLRAVPQDDATAALLDRLGMLHADLEESAQ